MPAIPILITSPTTMQVDGVEIKSCHYYFTPILFLLRNFRFSCYQILVAYQALYFLESFDSIFKIDFCCCFCYLNQDPMLYYKYILNRSRTKGIMKKINKTLLKSTSLA